MSEYDILEQDAHRVRVLAWAGALGGTVALVILVLSGCCYYLPTMIALPVALLSLLASFSALAMSGGKGEATGIAILGAVSSGLASVLGLMFGCLLCGGFAYIAAFIALGTM